MSRQTALLLARLALALGVFLAVDAADVVASLFFDASGHRTAHGYSAFLSAVRSLL